MTEEMKFFMYLLEYYAAYKNMKSGDVLKEWETRLVNSVKFYSD